MYERFTDRARKMMQFANEEAQRLYHEYIDTEHILLGLVKNGNGIAVTVLKSLDVDLRKIRLETERLLQTGPETQYMGKLPHTPRVKKAIEYAMDEARNFNHNFVGTEHLLLGLMREHTGIAYQVLSDLGLQLENVREEVINVLGSGNSASNSEKPTSTSVCRKDFEGTQLVCLQNYHEWLQVNHDKEFIGGPVTFSINPTNFSITVFYKE